MAMAGNHSPRHSSNTFQSQRARPPPVSSPWNQVVRGESEPVPAAPSSVVASAMTIPEPPISPAAAAAAASTVATSLPAENSSSVGENTENFGGNNGTSIKRPAWNKPSSNGGASEVRPVMGAVSWPALSESTRATIKSDSQSKGLLDGSSVPQSQGTGSKSSSSSSQRQVGENANANNMVPTRQRSFKHNSSYVPSNGGHQQPSAPQASIAGIGSHNYSPKEHTHRGGFGSNEHQHQPRSSFRNRNSGPHQRGDGAHHHNYGNRRDQDWNSHRNFNGRDNHMSPRGYPRFIGPPPPPNSAQFIPPPPVRSFGGHMGFHELAPPPMLYVAAPPPPYPDSARGVPFVPPPMPHHAMFFTGPDPQLQTKIVNQINYYFSDENLIKDIFLRQNMDDQGWVPIKLIAGFNKVMHLTDNMQLILDAVRTSSDVEVQGDKIRRRNDWGRWIISPSLQFPNVTSSQTLGIVNHDSLAEQVQNIALETTKYDGKGGVQVLPDASQQNPSFGDLNNPLQLSGSEVTGQVGIQGSDHSKSARK